MVCLLLLEDVLGRASVATLTSVGRVASVVAVTGGTGTRISSPG